MDSYGSLASASDGTDFPCKRVALSERFQWQQLARHGGVAQTSEFLRRDLHGFGLDTVVVHPERILHADKTLRDAT